MYTYKEVGGGRYVLSIDNHEEISAALAAFCEEKGIFAGTVYGIGAINKATFRYLNPETMRYVDKTFEEQMEITNLTGNISERDGKVWLHLHITASRSDYSCIGGHLLTAWISGACELVVEAFDVPLSRRLDPDLGITLYDL